MAENIKTTAKISKCIIKIIPNDTIREKKDLIVEGNNLKEVKKVFDEEWSKQ